MPPKDFQVTDLTNNWPFLLEFGPVFDSNVNLVHLSFTDTYGVLWKLKKPPVAPRDYLQHTYELNWEDEYYAIRIDGLLVAFGKIKDDFTDPQNPQYVESQADSTGRDTQLQFKDDQELVKRIENLILSSIGKTDSELEEISL